MNGGLVYLRRERGNGWEVSADRLDWRHLPFDLADASEAMEAAKKFSGAALIALTDRKDPPAESSERDGLA